MALYLGQSDPTWLCSNATVSSLQSQLVKFDIVLLLFFGGLTFTEQQWQALSVG
jgi:hypothetical protein